MTLVPLLGIECGAAYGSRDGGGLVPDADSRTRFSRPDAYFLRSKLVFFASRFSMHFIVQRNQSALYPFPLGRFCLFVDIARASQILEYGGIFPALLT